MTKTEDLIAQLAKDGAATPGAGSLRRFVLPLLLTALACAAATALVLDDPFPTFARQGWAPMVVKWGFSIPLMLLAALALHLGGQPGRASGWAVALLALPFAAILLPGMPSLLQGLAPFPGEAWQRCLAAMAIMSPIGFAAAIAATRWLAPVNLRRAGCIAGFFGGALAMSAYAPFCPGEGMAYLLVFYCAPIMAMAAIGWLAGPRLLRW